MIYKLVMIDIHSEVNLARLLNLISDPELDDLETMSRVL